MSSTSAKKSYVESIKREGCLCCGCDITEIIELHHVDGAEKRFNISSRISSVPMSVLIAEVAKCVPLCPTCHALADRDPEKIQREDPDNDNSPYICIRHRSTSDDYHAGW